MSISRRALSASNGNTGLYAGPEVNIRQGGRHPITGSLLAKMPNGGKGHTLYGGVDSAGLSVVSSKFSNVFTPTHGLSGNALGGSLLGSRKMDRANEWRPDASVWSGAKNDLDGSKRSKAIQSRVDNSVARMKMYADLGLVIK